MSDGPLPAMNTLLKEAISKPPILVIQLSLLSCVAGGVSTASSHFHENFLLLTASAGRIAARLAEQTGVIKTMQRGDHINGLITALFRGSKCS